MCSGVCYFKSINHGDNFALLSNFSVVLSCCFFGSPGEGMLSNVLLNQLDISLKS